MDPISALIGAGASLLGGFMNSSATQSANAANLQFAQQQASGAFLPSLIANAKHAGINPLAVLPGASFTSPGAQQVGGDPGSGLSAAGKILAEMKLPGADAPTKIDQLKAELLQSQIDNTNAETTQTMIRNSHLAMATQPAKGNGDQLFQRLSDGRGGYAWVPSDKFARTQFGPTSWISSIPILPALIGRNLTELGSTLKNDASSVWDTVRPDVLRFFENQQALPY